MEFTTAFPSGPTPWDRTTFAARQSPAGIPRLTTGISRSATREVTTRPSAAPVITPTASASAFCLRRNSRNSRTIRASCDGSDYRCLLLLFGGDDDGRIRAIADRHFPEHFGANGENE